MADDSLAKLEEFNALLAKTLGDVQEGTSELENEGSAYDQAAADAAQKIGALSEQLSEWLERLGSDGEEAGARLRELSQAAADGADDRLADMDDRFEATGTAAGQRVDAGQETLETGFADLRERGFATLAGTLEELESESEELDGQVAEDFAELRSAIASTRDGMVASGAERVQELGEAQTEVDQLESSVSEAADELTSGVEEQQGASEGDTEAIASALDTMYDGWSSEAASSADEYVTAMESAFADVAEALGTAGEELGQAVDRAREQALSARESDLGLSAAVLEAGEQLATTLDPIVDELEIVLRIVDQIQQLLS